jgi:hypothetical protein
MDEKNGAASTNGAGPGQPDDDRARLEQLWAVVDQIRERNAHIDPDEILAEVTAEVEAVRQERYERDTAAKQRRR